MKAKKFTIDQMNALIIESLNRALEDLFFGKEKDELDSTIQFAEVRRTLEHKPFTYRINISAKKDKEGILKNASISIMKNPK